RGGRGPQGAPRLGAPPGGPFGPAGGGGGGRAPGPRRPLPVGALGRDPHGLLALRDGDRARHVTYVAAELPLRARLRLLRHARGRPGDGSGDRCGNDCGDGPLLDRHLARLLWRRRTSRTLGGYDRTGSDRLGGIPTVVPTSNPQERRRLALAVAYRRPRSRSKV